MWQRDRSEASAVAGLRWARPVSGRLRPAWWSVPACNVVGRCPSLGQMLASALSRKAARVDRRSSASMRRVVMRSG